MDPKEALKGLYANLGRVILGKQDEILLLITALLARGHVLLEDVPGTGKTVLAKTLARSLQADFKRLQCTPDLMPSDVSGVSIWRQDRHEFEFKPGPAFTDVLLADEINRATPRAQSCLLECMEERQITVDGVTRALAPTFFVIATQNPVGFQGTYPLPEAQLDRFLIRLRLGYPAAESETAMLAERMRADPAAAIQPVMDLPALARLQAAAQAVDVAPEVLRYIAELARATRSHRDVLLGCSPRGSLALMRVSQAQALITGRNFVTPDHVKRVAAATLAHRLLLKQGSDSAAAERVIAQILSEVSVPVAKAA